MSTTSPTAQDCYQALLRLDIYCAKALTNLVMALASHKTDSVVALSQSSFYHYQYSSTADAIDALCREP